MINKSGVNMTIKKEKYRKRILAYRAKYPDRSKTECAKDLKMHLNTVINHMKEIEKGEKL